jgi:hypothetical protein
MVDDVYIEASTKNLVIDGKKYRFALERKGMKGHIGNLVFKPVEPDYEDRVKKMASYLQSNTQGLTVQMILEESLKQLPPKELRKLEKNIELKKKPKVEKGCVSLNVNGQVITIVP